MIMRSVPDNEIPEEFAALDLPQVKDAINRIASPINPFYMDATLTTTDNMHVQRLQVDMHYEDGRLPPPREFVVWVDGYDLIVRHIAEMP